MFGLVPGRGIHVEIIHQCLRIIVVSFRFPVKGRSHVLRGEEMLVDILLPVLHELAVHQLSFGIVVIDKHQVNRGRGKVVSIFIFAVFLNVKLALASFSKGPSTAGLQFISDLLDTFHISGRGFRILVGTSGLLYLVPVSVQVAFNEADGHFCRVLMQFVLRLVFWYYRILAARVQ